MNITKKEKPEHKFKLIQETIKSSPSVRAADTIAAVKIYRVETAYDIELENIQLIKAKQEQDHEIEKKKLLIEEKKIENDFFKFFIKVLVCVLSLFCGMMVFIVLIYTGNFALALFMMDFKALSPLVQIIMYSLTGGSAAGVAATAAYKYLPRKKDKQESEGKK